jgi:hypothetical protein
MDTVENIQGELHQLLTLGLVLRLKEIILRSCASTAYKELLESGLLNGLLREWECGGIVVIFGGICCSAQ